MPQNAIFYRQKKSGIEQVMRKATGNEDYQFGDVTKNAMKGFLDSQKNDFGSVRLTLGSEGREEYG